MCMIQAVHSPMCSSETIVTAHEDSGVMVIYDPTLYLERYIKFKKVILAIQNKDSTHIQKKKNIAVWKKNTHKKNTVNNSYIVALYILCHSHGTSAQE